MAANVWINEIDYDQVGTDHDEFIELAGVTSTSLVGWSLVFYNGNGGAQYDSIELNDTFVLTEQQNGMGTLAISAPGLQNGNPDGIALVDNNGVVVQFLSYGGSFTASGGLADGIMSTDVGITDSNQMDGSLALNGTGHSYEDFSWGLETQNIIGTRGSINGGQTFTNEPAVFSGDTSGSVEEFVMTTAVGALVVTDADSSTDVIAQNGAASDNGYGTFSIDIAGAWTFTAAPDNATIEALDTGETLSDFLSVETADGTTTKIGITIQGITDITGTTGNDKVPPIVGTDVRDLIDALAGNDEVFGQGGADIIIGAGGADILHGGKDGDTFVYDEKACGTSTRTRDRIADFSSSQHDVIDFSAIDANPSTEADDALHLLTNKRHAAAKVGSVWISKGDGHDIVYINNSATHDGFDMAIDVHAKVHLLQSDFLL